MTNGNVLVYDFIEDYEEELYNKYKLLKSLYGRNNEKTEIAYKAWKNILKFVFDEGVDAAYTLLKFKNAIDFAGMKLAYHDQEADFNEYWSAITVMYYKIDEQIRRMLK